MVKKKAEKKVELKVNGESIKIGKGALDYSWQGSSNEELRRQLKKIVAKEIFSPNCEESNRYDGYQNNR